MASVVDICNIGLHRLGLDDIASLTEGTQKARDSDRKQILQDELKTEEQKLADLKKEYNNGEPERRGDERNFAKYQERTTMMKENIALEFSD